MKQRNKRILFLVGLTFLFVLAGCNQTSAIDENSTGFWDHWIVWNFSRAITWLSETFGNSYGLGIIVFTIIVRFILLPLMWYQMKSMRKTTELQPKLKALQTQYASKDVETQQALQRETKKLYAEAGVNPVAGCLPLIVQMPILIALYQAINRTEVLKTGHFLWTELGQRDPYFVFPILAAILTFATSKLSSMSQVESNPMMNSMTYMMPVMILFMGATLPSALSLYWVVTNAFSVGQTLVLNNPFKIRRERKEEERQKRERERALEKAKHPKKKKKK